MQFSIRGYNDKQLVLLEKVLDHLFDFKIDEKRFDILREEFIRSLKNFKAEQPYQHAIYYLALILTENAWANSELLDAMECRLTAFILKKIIYCTLYKTTFLSAIYSGHL